MNLAPNPARRPVAKPAKFAPDPARRVMIAKVKIAQKDLDFDDGDYRALLERVTGARSAAELSAGQLGRVLDEFKRLGWAPTPKAGAAHAPARPADHPSARKARALYLSLGLLGVLRDASEAGLEAFARRQLGCTRLQWSDQAQVYKLIEALKAIAERHGWDQSVAGLADPIRTLKCRLCEAIIRRSIASGALPASYRLGDALAGKLGFTGRVADATERDFEQLATLLGRRFAHHVADGYYED